MDCYITLEMWHRKDGCLSGFEDLLPSSRYCYSINLSDLKTWHDAEDICKNISSCHGGHLATINSMQLSIAMSTWIRNQEQENMTTEIWIGLQNIDIEKGSKFKTNYYEFFIWD